MTKLKKGDTVTFQTSITVKKEKDFSKCATYTDAAKQIMTDLGLDIEDEKTLFKIATHIKRYGHNAKLSVYDRVNVYYKDVSSNFVKDTLATKIATHTHLKDAHDRELIWHNPNFM